MKWLLMVLAFVLGAVTTWFLTVKRGTRPVDGASAVVDQAAGGVGVEHGEDDVVLGLDDDPSRFGGERTPLSETVGPAERWDRNAEDVDALLTKSGSAGAPKEVPAGDEPRAKEESDRRADEPDATR